MKPTSCTWLAIGALAIGISAADAARQPDHLVGHPEFEAATGAPARVARAVAHNQVPAELGRAWALFQSHARGQWRSLWDADTGVPLRIYGSGIEAPGAVASPEAAARAAARVLAGHVALLAPGASASDFELVSNQLDRDMRTVGFEQRHRGVPVIGGQVSFRFKNDRLFVIGSEALPHVSARAPRTTVAEKVARQHAVASIEQAFGFGARASDVEGPMVLPIVRPRTDQGTQIQYVDVVAVRVDSADPIGRWTVYVDAVTGAAVARRQLLRFYEGTVHYNAPVRRPGDERAEYPAAFANLTVAGAAQTTGADGVATWDNAEAITVATAVSGPFVGMTNQAGSLASVNLALSSGGSVVWDDRGTETVDAQITTFVHANIAKEFARRLNPSLEWLDAQMPARVNINQNCNAFSDGNSINFYRANQQCANTGQLADVVYHEFGHSLHAQSIIRGVGSFESALSEGISDYLAATITDDPAMGRGFFHTAAPLRHIDPADRIHRWPQDIASTPHGTGLIFAGAMWTLRKELIEEMGEVEGIELADRLYYAAMQRASDIPTTYVEILAADDDDGDLSNGTPNGCTIAAAFGRHGLADPDSTPSVASIAAPTTDGLEVFVGVSPASGDCPVKIDVVRIELEWRRRGQGGSGAVVAMDAAEGGYRGAIPDQAPGQVIQYQVKVWTSDGIISTYPDNPADPYYEMFVGEVIPLYCTDFSTDPIAEGWTHALAAGENREGADDWQWDAPAGRAGSGDPTSAYVGEKVFGNDLGHGNFDGKYQSNIINFALTPEIATGEYDNVRLQYRRWLTVEDGYFDQATIYANGDKVWGNLNSNQGNASTVHHLDKEWRFHDVDLSAHVREGSVQLKFELSSDGGLEFGGWTLDDLCVVAYVAAACPEGEDGCEDPGVDGDSGGCGCQAGRTAPSAPLGAALLSLLGLALVLARRRASRHAHLG